MPPLHILYSCLCIHSLSVFSASFISLTSLNFTSSVSVFIISCTYTIIFYPLLILRPHQPLISRSHILLSLPLLPLFIPLSPLLLSSSYSSTPPTSLSHPTFPYFPTLSNPTSSHIVSPYCSYLRYLQL